LQISVPNNGPTAGPRRDVLALLWHFVEAYPSRTLTVVALLSVAGLCEGVSVLALLPFVQLALAGDAGNSDQASQWISRALAFVGLVPSVGSLLLLIVAGIGVKAAVTLLAMKEAGYAVSQMMTDLRRRLIAALMEAKWSYFVARPIGLFANAICAETIRAGMTYQQSARLAAASIQAIIYCAVTVIVSWKIALFAVIAGGVGAVMIRKIMAAAHLSGARQTDLMQSLAIRMTDALQGIKAIKVMAAERAATPLLDGEVRELDAAQRSQIWTGEFLRVTQEPLLVVILAIGIYGTVKIGSEPLPTLMVIAILFYRLFNRFQLMQEIYQNIGVTASAYWAVYQLCRDTEREGERSSSTMELKGGLPRIEFAAVSFGYGGTEVLRNVSMRIEPGEFVAVSGPSGAGKTTLLDLVSGLQSPQAGSVLVGGNDLADTDLHGWRRRIGYVPQEMLLLHDTIYRNICLGDETISRARAEEALRAAGVWDVVVSLPDGLDTVVGERGSRFSGGERQRISLARALARGPLVLLLDEITASLDKDTEQAVCATLRQLAGQMTIIAVSHQVAVARAADRVVQLENGKLRDGRVSRDVGALNVV
jgi:ATP-binding cassette, subfamily C, bacterial